VDFQTTAGIDVYIYALEKAGKVRVDSLAVGDGGGGAVTSVDTRTGDVTLDDLYEPVFVKNTAFNKNFGAGAGQVAEGNALAAKMSGPVSSQINQIFVAVDENGNAKIVPVKIDNAGNITGINNLSLSGDIYILTGKHFYFSTDVVNPTALTVRFELIVQADGDIFLQSWSGGSPTLLLSINGATKTITLAGLIVSGNPLFINTIKSGATQGGAGAAANEVWKTSGHGSLPDNVLMIGV
jgi:hypothetical protein